MKKKVFLFFTNPITKSIVLTLLPIVYGITYPLSLSSGWQGRNNKLFSISVLLTLVDIIIAFAYIIYDMKKQNEYNSLIQKSYHSVALTKSNKAVDNILKDTSLDLYDRINKTVTHSFVMDWQYVQNRCDVICLQLLVLLKQIASVGNDFSVSIIFREKSPEDKNGFRMVARQSDHNTETPRTYHNFITDEEADGMYYKKIFDTNPSRVKVLATRKEIKTNFKEPDAKHYSQYVGIPIKCKNNIVALLQIIAYNDSRIEKNRKSIITLCDDYFSTYANLILLVDKIENVSQIINKNEK